MTEYDPKTFHYTRVPEYQHTRDEKEKLEGGKVKELPPVPPLHPEAKEPGRYPATFDFEEIYRPSHADLWIG